MSSIHFVQMTFQVRRNCSTKDLEYNIVGVQLIYITQYAIWLKIYLQKYPLISEQAQARLQMIAQSVYLNASCLEHWLSNSNPKNKGFRLSVNPRRRIQPIANFHILTRSAN